MGHTDKEVLQKARELVAAGLDQRKAIGSTLLAEGLNFDKGRKRYLFSFLERKLRDDARRNAKKEAAHPAQTVVPSPAPVPLSFQVTDDGTFIFVRVGDCRYRYKATTKDVLLKDFHSETPGDTFAKTSGDIHYKAKIEALTYFRRLAPERQRILVKIR